MQKDIHDYEGKIAQILDNIQHSTEITEKTRKLLMDFDRYIFLVEQLSKPRRVKLVGTIFFLARKYFKGCLEDVNEDNIKDCIKDAETKKGSSWTPSNYKGAIKKFYMWVAYGDNSRNSKEVPKMVSWMTLHVRKKDRRQVQASDILTEEEVQHLISTADNSRDRAFIAMLYEMGARIGEIGNLSIKDIIRDKYSFLVDLTGKTGHRTPRIVMSDPYVSEWLNNHPLKDDREAPLWVCSDRAGGYKAMMYTGLRAVVLRLKDKAGIKKRLYPHLFRHSRATHLLMKRQLNEAQAKVYFGWTPDSKMLSEYAHLLSRDVNDTILEINGIKPDEEKHEKQSVSCPKCKRINSNGAKYCVQCSSILDPKTAFLNEEPNRIENQLLSTIMQDENVKQAILNRLMEIDVAKLKEFLNNGQMDTKVLQNI